MVSLREEVEVRVAAAVQSSAVTEESMEGNIETCKMVRRFRSLQFMKWRFLFANCMVLYASGKFCVEGLAKKPERARE